MNQFYVAIVKVIGNSPVSEFSTHNGIGNINPSDEYCASFGMVQKLSKNRYDFRIHFEDKLLIVKNTVAM